VVCKRFGGTEQRNGRVESKRLPEELGNREEEEQRSRGTEKRIGEEPVGATVPAVAPTVNSREELSMPSLKEGAAARQVRTVHPRPPSTTKGIPILRKRLTKNGKVGGRSRKAEGNGSAEKEWNVPLTLDREELLAMLQECLTDFATEVGLKVACLLFDKQVDISCRPASSGRNGSERRRSVTQKRR
jgi:hypothetical protein